MSTCEAVGNTDLLLGDVLWKCAVVDIAIQMICFVIAAILKTEKFFDISASATYITLVILSLFLGGQFYLRQRIQSSMAVAWACRLGLFLLIRVITAGEDRRFSEIRKSPLKFFVSWTLQAVWIFATLFPTLIQNAKQLDTSVTAAECVGWSMWIFGFLLETTADGQKSYFKANPANKGKFISVGVWSVIRHPNYMGEITMWTGLFIAASRTLVTWQFVSVVSPVFTILLLTKVSGIPILEKQGEAKWGSDPEYQAYMKRTKRLIPFIY